MQLPEPAVVTLLAVVLVMLLPVRREVMHAVRALTEGRPGFLLVPWPSRHTDYWGAVSVSCFSLLGAVPVIAESPVALVIERMSRLVNCENAFT